MYYRYPFKHRSSIISKISYVSVYVSKVGYSQVFIYAALIIGYCGLVKACNLCLYT